MMSAHRQRGFTIVELLIVVVVIAILATITIVAYNGIKDRANRSSLSSSLANAARKMQTAGVEAQGVYPTTLPTGVNPSPGVGLSLSVTGSAGEFCINGTMNNGALNMYYDSTKGSSQDGLCSGAPISGSETGAMPINLIIAPESVAAWAISTSAGQLSFSSRAGTAGDPIPTKPVMVYSNATARTVTWAYVRTAVDTTKIKAGRSYTASFWMRKTGTGYNGIISNGFGVMDGNTSNQSLPPGPQISVPTTWTKMSRTATAPMDALATNSLYNGISAAAFATTGWAFEFQGFELYEN